jgi:SAM-dependent methyltransferase
MSLSLEQHNIEILQNRELWEKKALLRKVYSEFYSEIKRRVNPARPGLTVELGSGMGNIKQHIPQCITTDIFPNPWLDRVESAYHLSFDHGEVGHLILFDVWHHLRYPGTALKEFARVLAPEGRIILFEPAMGLIGRFVFGHFHHEPLGLKDEIEFNAPDGFSGLESTYYAAQGMRVACSDQRLSRTNFVLGESPRSSTFQVSPTLQVAGSAGRSCIRRSFGPSST